MGSTGTALWKKVLFGLVTAALFFALIEGILVVAGVRPVLQQDDPFVGFAANIPLYVPGTGTDGQPVLRTAPNKRLFNLQEFPRPKPAGTYRIFCVGGSTTYGRPYDDTSSFAGWLRELLPIAEPDRNWEVINAGGVSYASYRVARLMNELAGYEPDLFIVYSGQNEFLEERTYRGLKSIPGPLRALGGFLSRFRLWALLSGLLGGGPDKGSVTQLAEEADTILEHFGPDAYERDDELRRQVLRHYRHSLERMVEIARSAGAKILFVSPASNLKDCSPFKSQHTDGLDPGVARRSRELLTGAKEHIRNGEWSRALAVLDQAIGIDPRYAEHHYRRGKVLLELGRAGEAHAALTRALDEDVCPLRALPSMIEILSEVARETNSPFVDFPRRLALRAEQELGYPIPGDESFLDHVHPTIAGYGILAAQLIDPVLTAVGSPASASLTDADMAGAKARIESRLAPADRARSLSNLARVLSWSGKIEDAVRPAEEALAFDVDDPEVVFSAANILATWWALEGDDTKERHYYGMALTAKPRSSYTHWRVALRAFDRDPPEVERGLAHALLAGVYWEGPRRDAPHQVMGGVLASRGQWKAALSHLLEARAINPANTEATSLIAQVTRRLGPAAAAVTPPKITVDTYPSGAVRRMVMVRLDPAGKPIPDGIWTEWHENGLPSRYLDMADGARDGVEMTWDETGRVTSRPAP